jgi:hypothetical protein
MTTLSSLQATVRIRLKSVRLHLFPGSVLYVSLFRTHFVRIESPIKEIVDYITQKFEGVLRGLTSVRGTTDSLNFQSHFFRDHPSTSVLYLG